MGRELTCFKVELQQRDRQIPNNTDEVSLYPCKCPKSPPTLSHTPTQPNSSSPSPASTKPSQPSNSQNEAETPAASRNTETLRKILQLQPQLRNSQWKQRLTLPSSWTPMGSSYKEKNCFQAVKQQNSGAQKQEMPSEYFLTPALAHPHISSYTQAPTTWEGNRRKSGSWSTE